MPTFTWTPDRGPTKDTTTRVNAMQFGDGYSQRVANGINSVIESWPLVFSLRTKVEITAIDDFLITQGGVASFDWTTPKGQFKKFICKTWRPLYNHDGDASISMTFDQVFET